jgi:hypothetical protein
VRESNDPVARGEGGGDSRADGLDLSDALDSADGAGNGRLVGIDALDAVDVGGVDGGGQHLDAHVRRPKLHWPNIRQPGKKGKLVMNDWHFTIISGLLDK